jgi:hypothetical protein
MRRFVLALAAMSVMFGGCGTVSVTGGDDGSDGSPQDSTIDAPDSGSDVGGKLDSTGLVCESDVDCLAMKGKTPCNVPQCQDKVCKLTLRKEHEKCDNPLDPSGDCEEASCSADGQCVKAPIKDKTLCGVGKCGKLCKAGQCVTATSEDYEDGNPCTNDFCDQGQAVEHTPITDLGKSCDDGNACTTGDSCVAGTCQGQAQSCDDNIPCTTDTCTKGQGCVHTPVTSKCDDGNPCTKDACDLAVGCTVAGNEKAKVCDDGNSCTTGDLCVSGACTGKPSCACSTDADCVQYNGSVSPCLGKFKCSASKCVLDAATAVQCEKGEDTACIKNTCDAKTGTCAPLPAKDGADCDDDNACTSKSTCQKGACSGSPDLGCDDKNPCTTDACTPQKGCTYTPNADNCNDANACTSGDVCGSGACKGAAKLCADNLSCTVDKCDPESGDCSHKLDDTLCDDGNPCTNDSCALGSGCVHGSDDTGTCDDGNDCTKESCTGGKCVSVVTCLCNTDADCNDNNPCTADTCQAGKCTSVAQDGGACDDTGNKCLQPGSGTCQAGSCTGGKPVDCSAMGNACNTATCSPATGKCETVSKTDGTPCDADGSGCTAPDACQGGKCQAGAPVTCTSGDACNAAVCQSTGPTSYSCGKKPLPPATPCDDGKFCTQNDQCDAVGKCQGGGQMACPGNSCTNATCDEATKACISQPKLKGTNCDDGKFCTTGDSCDGQGVCLSGQLLKCQGAPPCGNGTCDEATDQCVVVYAKQCCVSADQCDDGEGCTKDFCSVPATGGAGTCGHDVVTTCCLPEVYVASFDQGKLSGIEIVNSTESTLQGWQLRADSPIFVSKPGVLYYGDIKADNFVFSGQPHHGSALTPPFALPNQGAGAVLSFQVYFDTEQGNGYDKFVVSIVMPDGVKKEVWSKSGEQPNLWNAIKVPLDGFGGPVRIEFLFDTVDAIGNTGKGVFLDDVLVNAQCK